VKFGMNVVPLGVILPCTLLISSDY